MLLQYYQLLLLHTQAELLQMECTLAGPIVPIGARSTGNGILMVVVTLHRQRPNRPLLFGTVIPMIIAGIGGPLMKEMLENILLLLNI